MPETIEAREIALNRSDDRVFVPYAIKHAHAGLEIAPGGSGILVRHRNIDGESVQQPGDDEDHDATVEIADPGLSSLNPSPAGFSGTTHYVGPSDGDVSVECGGIRMELTARGDDEAVRGLTLTWQSPEGEGTLHLDAADMDDALDPRYRVDKALDRIVAAVEDGAEYPDAHTNACSFYDLDPDQRDEVRDLYDQADLRP